MKNKLSQNVFLGVLLISLLSLLFFSCEEEEELIDEDDTEDTSGEEDLVEPYSIVFGADTLLSLNYDSAVVQSTISSIEGTRFQEFGHMWSLTENPSYDNFYHMSSHTVTSTTFTSTIGAETDIFLEDTTIYVRTYATYLDYDTVANEYVTVVFYGEQFSFEPLDFVVPTLTTSEATEITTVSATSGGSITDNGGEEPEYGIVWGTTENPTVDDHVGITYEGFGEEEFTSTLAELEEETTYYVRAWGTNSAGTGYGNQVTFTTKREPRTYVPDNYFEQALIDQGYDDVLDDSVATVNISSITTLNIVDTYIEDLTGVEDFAALEYLNCTINEIKTIDLSHNTQLKTLLCSSNDLTSLDLSSNTALTYLECSYNDLTSLDLSQNTLLESLLTDHNSQLSQLDLSSNTALEKLLTSNCALTQLNLSSNINLEELDCSYNNLTSLDLGSISTITELDCSNNQLTALDVSSISELRELDCGQNQITSLDVSNSPKLTNLDCAENNVLSSLNISNTALEYLDCQYNALTDLDISTNTALEVLYLPYNQISSLDPSNSTKLNTLICNSNALVSLDLSNNPLLEEIFCSDNDLLSLNLQNGNNQNLKWMTADNNSSLTCIEVDDPDAAVSYSGWSIPSGASYSLSCD